MTSILTILLMIFNMFFISPQEAMSGVVLEGVSVSGGVLGGGYASSATPFSFSDDFNRADGALGDDWTAVIAGIAVLSNAAQKDTSAVTSYYVLSASPSVENGTISGVLNRENNSYTVPALIFRYVDSNNYYYAGISDNAYGADTLFIRKYVAGSSSSVATQSYTISADTNYTISIVFSGTSLKLYANSVLQIDTTDDEFSGGNVGMWMYQNVAGATGKIDDFSVVES